MAEVFPWGNIHASNTQIMSAIFRVYSINHLKTHELLTHLLDQCVFNAEQVKYEIQKNFCCE